MSKIFDFLIGTEMYKKVPFDIFCPSLVKKKEILRRICKKCGDYFPSVAALNRHSVIHRNIIQETEDSNDEVYYNTLKILTNA